MKKYLFVTIFVVAIYCLFDCIVQHTVYANDSSLFISRQGWGSDDNIVNFQEDYNFPVRLVVVLIDKNDLHSDSVYDIRELYYYFATRSGIGDFPFHYLIASDGSVYSGNIYGDEAKINLSETEEAIFIAYIRDGSENLTVSSVDSLKNFILDVINTYAISPESVEVRDLNYEFGEKLVLENISLSEPSERWQSDIEAIKTSILREYSPNEIIYSLELGEVQIPEEPQNPQETVEIKIKVKNTGDFNIYSSTASNIYVTRNDPFDEKSMFYINDVWSSLSRVALLDESQRLLSGEEGEFQFNIHVPLYPPERSEQFILVDPKGNIIEGTEFDINLKINATESTIIEITDTSVGYLNVRQTPGLGEVVTKVTPGDRFIVLEYNEGYYKIEANGKEGWVVNTYVKVVN